MNKTPVSILQEMMVKKQMVPNYELIHNGGGTHINTFTYQVTCDGFCATGTGRCKKDAKHEAAKAMLETIAAHRGYPQLPASPAQSPVRTPLPTVIPASPRALPNVPFVNTIGSLQELCFKNNLQEPDYCLISDVGPPHAKVFTIQCVVATFKEEGIATTKKQAKHEAARKMMNRINDVIADLKLMDEDELVEYKETRQKELLANEIAKARYPMLSKLSLTKKVNLGLKISEYHTKLKDSVKGEICEELIEKLSSLAHQNDNGNFEELANQLLLKTKEILSPLNLQISQINIELECDDRYGICTQVDTDFNLTEISIEKTLAKAKYTGILKLIDTIIFFLK